MGRAASIVPCPWRWRCRGDAQLELIDAHPRIGAPPESVSAHSYIEQGYDRESAAAGAEAERARIAAELEQLNRAYEERFGFRYVIFVAGRPRARSCRCSGPASRRTRGASA